MAIYLKNDETERLARQVAKLTGETLTDAVRISLRERLRRETLKRGRKPWDEAAIKQLIARFQALPVLDDRSADDIIGYDEHGVPR